MSLVSLSQPLVPLGRLDSLRQPRNSANSSARTRQEQRQLICAHARAMTLQQRQIPL